MDINKDKISLKELSKEVWFWPVSLVIIVLFILIIVNVITGILNKTKEDQVDSKLNNYKEGTSSQVIHINQSFEYDGNFGTLESMLTSLEKFQNKYRKNYSLVLIKNDITSNIKHYNLYAGNKTTSLNYNDYIEDLSFNITSASGLRESKLLNVQLILTKDNRNIPNDKQVKVYLDLLDHILIGVYPDLQEDRLNLMKKDMKIPNVKEYIKIKKSKSNFIVDDKNIAMPFKSWDNKNISKFEYHKTSNNFIYTYKAAK